MMCPKKPQKTTGSILAVVGTHDAILPGEVRASLASPGLAWLDLTF